ncbi:MAG TPA: hypothetical protein VLT85_11215 [Terriglobales bacterium]|nr:hypothetical protein [Terriglobales bacterium]
MVLSRRTTVALVVGLLLLLVPAASAQHRRVVVRPLNPYFYYNPFFYGPYYPDYYGYGPMYVRPERVGYVKIETHLKDARIYVDGGYAGVTGKLKEFPLRPGTHDLVVKDSDGRPIYQERVAVFLGKTTKLRVD